jgi:hypothetical protein
MHDGRIHPTRIEEIVEKVKVDIDKLMYEEAEKIIFELGLADFHPELIKVLGRLKYRTSYGQQPLPRAKPRISAASWPPNSDWTCGSPDEAPCCTISARR